MKRNSAITAGVVLSFAMGGLAACEKKGPAERAGASIDSAAKKAGENIKDAAAK